MPYIPPTYKQLMDGSKRLSLSLAPRFTPKKYSELRDAIHQLHSDYLRASQEKTALLSPSDSEVRRAQIDCIERLLSEVQSTPETRLNEEQCQLILLGALIFRYQRLLMVYKTTAKMPSLMGYVTWGVSLFVDMRPEVRCALLNVLKTRTLAVTPSNALDDWTIYISCLAYRDFVTQEHVSQRHPYISKDRVTFFAHLQAIIDEAQPAAQLLIEQITYINFIQSVAKALKEFSRLLNDSGDGRGSAVLQKLSCDPKFDRSVCSRKAIRTYLQKSGDLSACHLAYMENVLWEEDPNYTTPIPPQNFNAAMDLLDTQMLLRNHHTLLGAYAFVYLHCLHQPNKQPLLKAIGEVIGLDWQQSELLNTEALDFALEMLNDFASLPDIHTVLDIACWGESDPLQHFKNSLNLERRNVLQRRRDEQKSQEEMVHGFFVVGGN